MNAPHSLLASCDLAIHTAESIEKADAVLNEIFESYFIATSSDVFRLPETYPQVQNLVMVVMDYITNAKKQTNELINMLSSQKRVKTVHE
mgnify:CR=1 FL=1